MGSTS